MAVCLVFRRHRPVICRATTAGLRSANRLGFAEGLARTLAGVRGVALAELTRTSLTRWAVMW